MKIIAFYLPQFHTIPENDAWWGKGFTEWVNVKKAKPLYEGHNQPRVPLHKNYYNLLDEKPKYEQVRIAKEHHVDAFCFYHYWFNGKLLLEKPVEQFLQDTNLDIEFCLSWANEPWTNAWVSSNNKLLMEQTYGGKKEWKEHFDYLLAFFKDARYIKEDNCPLFIIYRPDIMECYVEMMSYWQELARTYGFDGIKFAYQHPAFHYDKSKSKTDFTYGIEYQPISEQYWNNNNKILNYTLKLKIQRLINKTFKVNIARKKKLTVKEYSKVWENIIKHTPDTNEVEMVPGAFVDWDNTPRRKEAGSVYHGANPETFSYYFNLQYNHAMQNYQSKYIFMFAWNEWAEGGYLEPDQKYEYKYLEAIKKIVESYKDANE